MYVYHIYQIKCKGKREVKYIVHVSSSRNSSISSSAFSLIMRRGDRDRQLNENGKEFDIYVFVSNNERQKQKGIKQNLSQFTAFTVLLACCIFLDNRIIMIGISTYV